MRQPLFELICIESGTWVERASVFSIKKITRNPNVPVFGGLVGDVVYSITKGRNFHVNLFQFVSSWRSGTLREWKEKIIEWNSSSGIWIRVRRVTREKLQWQKTMVSKVENTNEHGWLPFLETKIPYGLWHFETNWPSKLIETSLVSSLWLHMISTKFRKPIK